MKIVNIANTLDIQARLDLLHAQLDEKDKADVYTYNFFAKPFIQANNWITKQDMHHIFYLTGFEIVSEYRKHFEQHYIVRKSPSTYSDQEYSVSVIIPAKNEAGTISSIVKRMPKLGKKTELIFVVGESTDETYASVVAAKRQFKRLWPIKIIDQGTGRGKGDAVRKGFAHATCDIVMIYDADMSIDPEEMIKFYNALKHSKGELVMGNRLVYPLEKDSMRFLNILGNKFFASVFTRLLNQPIKDTLCGTKALFLSDYWKISKLRSYYGSGDPFGDFDIILGAAKFNMKIIEIPIHYKARVYGKTNIRRFFHGLQLFRMSLKAAVKIKLRL